MLLDLLDVEQVGDTLWRGMRKPGGIGRVFGGQVIAQAMMAASRSVSEKRPIHSLHAYFMRPGDEDYPIDFRVESDFDGRTFSNRRVVALQKDKPILNLTASFHLPEEGVSHQVAMPDVPMPEDLVSRDKIWEGYEELMTPQALRVMQVRNPIELRAVGEAPFFRREPTTPVAHVWFRAAHRVDAPQPVHRAIMAYASDFSLLATAFLPHAVAPIDARVQSASLDHAIWFHGDVAADDWLLYATDSPWSGHARGLSRGLIFTRDGRLVASTAQEGLIRLL